MSKTIFTGCGVAIATPFKDDDKQSIDYDVLTQLFDMHVTAGTDAMIVAGTTGEASTMIDDEHIEFLANSVKLLKGRMPLIAGVGSNYTDHAIKLAKAAERAGANALLCVTPYYNKASQEGLYQHFAATAKAVDLPIILYNVPSRTQCNIAPSTYKRLCEFDNIVAVKECNFSQLNEDIYLCQDRLDFYSGEDNLAIPLMSLGGKGVISVVANVIPEKVVEMTHSYLAGDIKKAGSIQVELQELISAMFCDVNPIPVKEALNMMGYKMGACRLPLCDTSKGNAEKIEQALRKYKLI